jgi:hypothetical protein
MARKRIWIAAAAWLAALPSFAQYPGQVAPTGKDAPTLRAVAVFEWTGDEAKPKTARLVPVCIYDGQELEDAGEYLARPFPLALANQVEYDLLRDGKLVGRFDVDRAEREQGAWMGYGKRLPLPVAKPAAQVAKIDEDDARSDEPVLHRKHQAADSSSGGSASGSSAPDPNAPPPDPDRPTLHKTDGSPESSPGSASPSGEPPNQGKQRGNSNQQDESYVESVRTSPDPNRPHLYRGQSTGGDIAVTPILRGVQVDMHQEVAVSDPTDRPVHVWDYIWADPGDAAKMKAAMEDLARAALGFNSSSTPSSAARKSILTSQRSAQATAPQPLALTDEKFRVFELAYGAGATMVLTAGTTGAGDQQKFVTLIAQPDLYGKVAVLVKSVTSTAHLDETPRMRLIDAVDALADNRGELLFELRGAMQRQFALYRVLRGDARRIFVTDPAPVAVTAEGGTE